MSFLKRIEDYCHWQRLEQWKFVIDRNEVEWEQSEYLQTDDRMLEDAVRLLKENRFPFAITCICPQYDRIMLKPFFWKELFDFVSGKRGIRSGEKEIFFDNLNEDIRKNILEAWILSVWMAE